MMIRLALPLVLLLTLGLSTAARAADTFKADAVHSAAVFRIKHGGISYFWGRFNDFGGTYTLDDADPTKSSFNIEIQAASVDTNNEKRDAHLKSPDFFNAKQYPAVAFKSSSVKKGEGNVLQVTGELSLHGVTKTVTLPVELTGKGDFAGSKRAGVEATIVFKMSDFEMKSGQGLSDEVKVIVALSGVKR